ncbi:MAG: hypothetical protein D6702_04170 [Planctomycetota bacterium]|nr:MAG: hypothetical protein D6702_04170 [Planctomycetota bacterium]
MNFDAFWQNNRRFLTGVAVGLLLFLIGRAVVSRTAGADIAAHERSIRASSNALSKAHVPANEVARAERVLADLEQRARELAELSLPPSAGDPAFADFAPAPGQSPSRHYIEFTGRRRSELTGLALLNDVDLDDSLGLPAESPTQAQAIARVLRGFYVVDRVVRAAIGAGARRIEDIRIETRRKKRRDQVLDLTPVSLDVVLPGEALDPFLSALVGAEPPLGLIGFEVLPADRKTGERRVALRFEAAPLPAVAEEEEEA